MKKVLEMLVHDIDHPIAERPQEKEGANQEECREMVAAVWGFEESVSHSWEGGRLSNCTDEAQPI
jgi:hypothetical protein